MEISVCIVLMVLSLLVGGVVTYFWLSRKYSEEISGLEGDILEIQRKGNHYKEHIEDKLLHAQNAAEDRKKELNAIQQAQKATENKCQQLQGQIKEKNGQMNENNAELKKLRKENDKINKEKASLLAAKETLLAEKEALKAENEFWLNEFDAKKDLLMADMNNEELFDNEIVMEYDLNGAKEMEGNEIAENVSDALDFEGEVKLEGEEATQADFPNLLNEGERENVERENTEMEVVSMNGENENHEVVQNEAITTLISDEMLQTEKAGVETEALVAAQEENEADTVIMAFPFSEEKEKMISSD